MWAASLVGEERVVLVNRPLMAVEGDTDIIRNVLFGDISQVPPSMETSPKRINLRYESGLYICNQVVVYSL